MDSWRAHDDLSRWNTFIITEWCNSHFANCMSKSQHPWIFEKLPEIESHDMSTFWYISCPPKKRQCTETQCIVCLFGYDSWYTPNLPFLGIIYYMNQSSAVSAPIAKLHEWHKENFLSPNTKLPRIGWRTHVLWRALSPPHPERVNLIINAVNGWNSECSDI